MEGRSGKGYAEPKRMLPNDAIRRLFYVSRDNYMLHRSNVLGLNIT